MNIMIRECKTFDEFVDYTGLMNLLDMENEDTSLIRNIVKKDLHVNESGMFETSDLKGLIEMVEEYSLIDKHYHIISLIDSDEGDELIYENEIRIVNRLGYFIGNGSPKPAYYILEDMTEEPEEES